VTAVLVARNQATEPTAEGLRSAVYEGTLCHRRFGPNAAHEFSYRVAMPLLYLDEVDSVTRLHPLWSSRRPAPVWFRRADFLGDSATALPEAVRNLVEERSGLRPTGPVALLANLRTWGWLFNPISMYFCMGADGEAVEALVAEVENTPWHERHPYVVGPPGRHRFAKVMHVSPFLPMDVEYELRYTAPGKRLVVQLDVLRGAERLLGVTLSLRRRALGRQALWRLLWDHPVPTHRISAGIYAQAARLRLRGAPFYTHPARRSLRPSAIRRARC
jgi:DUF1365 family protein